MGNTIEKTTLLYGCIQVVIHSKMGNRKLLVNSYHNLLVLIKLFFVLKTKFIRTMQTKING